MGLTGWGRGRRGGVGGLRVNSPPSNQQGATAAWEDNYECSCQRRHVSADSLEGDGGEWARWSDGGSRTAESN